MASPILSLNNVNKSYKKAEHQDLLVINNVQLTLYAGEIIALLGKSGSGKSTLLRLIAGLIPPTQGEVIYRGKVIHGPAHGISMVFQNFALLPWLTVLQNVELGLEALGVARVERRARALKTIDIIGLDGFESAFPKELSGGMRQRVGFARALVVDPDILIMDEPFSALDVLTADNLKSDLLDIWQSKKTQINAILFVTHNIEEAALLADRIIILGEEGNLKSELKVDLAHPRNDQSLPFRTLVQKIYSSMTRPKGDAKAPQPTPLDISYRLPDADISELAGLLEAMDDPAYGGKIPLPVLAESMHLNVADLFPLTEVLDMLRFANVVKGDLVLTTAGKLFANASILERKKIFARHLTRYVPLAQHIRRVLDERPGHRASKERFLNELEDLLSQEEAQRILKIVIDWGRYAEILAYDDSTGMLNLENPN